MVQLLSCPSAVLLCQAKEKYIFFPGQEDAAQVYSSSQRRSKGTITNTVRGDMFPRNNHEVDGT
jgi:hypothetical protein